MLECALRKDHAEVTFILPADIPPGPVSVASGPVTVELPNGSTRSFRYLAAGDYWFNDESAGDQDGPNSRLHT
ncbi:hypothetical protein [Streptomyces sp. NBC_01568]|uniref:hypothetical protein n=1 Tax=Streptomyces sp. NBC_01568 TaxID=2975882 RepID=UPI00386BF028